MQEYNVVFSETADRDLEDIVVYLSNFTPNIARLFKYNLKIDRFRPWKRHITSSLAKCRSEWKLIVFCSP